jgi:hypothetical protein
MSGLSTASTTEVARRLTGYSGAEREARIRIRRFERPARLRRAVAALGTWWAAALAAVFIPVAHFVLVPGLAVFGLFLFGQRLRTSAVVVAARGTCPDCGTEQDLDMLGPWREERGVSCRHCHRSLRLSPA